MIEVDKLSFSYDGTSWILKDISFSVNKGELIAVIGPNGSGKTTLLYCLSGIIPHLKKGVEKGKIILNGIDIPTSDFEDIIKRIGFLMHNPEEQFVALNVKHELMLGLANTYSKTERVAIFNETVERFNLRGIMINTPHELSMGQKQKVIIASILLKKPEIVFLDEPFSFLDLPSQKWTVEFIKKLKDEGKTIIVNTHKLDVIERIVDKVIGIKDGKVLFFKTISDLEKQDYQFLYNLEVNDTKAYELRCKYNKVILDIQNIFFKYPRQENWLLHEINLKLLENSIVGLIGRNGSGKSTLLSIFAGLMKPNRGMVLFQKENLHKICFKDLSNKIGIVFQNPDNQLFCDTIGEELSFGLKNQSLSREEINRRLNLVQNYFNLPNLSMDPNNLSFGWKKILTLAITLAMQPKVILFDEPDLGLDPFFQRKITKLIMNLYKEGITLLTSSHDIEMVNSISNQVLCLKDGCLIDYEECKNELNV